MMRPAPKQCTRCVGSGRVWPTPDDFIHPDECPDCHGTGEHDEVVELRCRVAALELELAELVPPRRRKNPGWEGWKKAMTLTVLDLPDGYRLCVGYEWGERASEGIGPERHPTTLSPIRRWTVERWPGPVIVARGNAATSVEARDAALAFMAERAKGTP